MTDKLFVLIIVITFFSSCKKEITIVTSEDAGTVETFAARELSKYLSKIYPEYKFPVSFKSDGGKTIYLNVTGNIPGVPDNDEGYLIKSDSDHAWILSNGNTGLIYGVYGILEKLGCGFYLSDEMLPEPRKDFDFKAWDYSNEPLVKERFIFNWHNFISGCTGWDKKHWIN